MNRAEKLFSARFVISIMTSFASSLLVGIVFYICWKANKIDVGVAVVMAYIAIWKEIVMAYFGRNDRPTGVNNEPTGNQK